MESFIETSDSFIDINEYDCQVQNMLSILSQF